ncbi:MAG: hypothetical protein J7K00_01915 [Candidatus Diapherotrites archaeon]|nr:hypothetical protein [Candidatus Diapherotrites archaeon]
MNNKVNLELAILNTLEVEEQMLSAFRFIGDKVDGILQTVSKCLLSVLENSELFIINIESVNKDLFDSLTDDDLELFCDAEFWQSYKELKEGNLKSGTIEDLRKSVGL